jgi:undecaprenyl-diphosphatase
VTRLGTLPACAAFGAVFAFWYTSRQGWLPLAGWLAALSGSELLAWALKHVVHRERPIFEVAYATEGTYSFPSSHVLGALVGYGMIVYFVVCLTSSRTWRALALTLGLSVVLAVGFSRLYLGLHFFSDVIGGLAAGAVWLTACVTALEVARRRQEVEHLGAAARIVRHGPGEPASELPQPAGPSQRRPNTRSGD